MCVELNVEKEQKVLYYQEGELREMPGYYIYYERNAEMQNYMAGIRPLPPVEKSKEILLLEKPKERYTEEQQNREEQPTVAMAHAADRKHSTFYQLFYATGGILTCIAILVIAGLAMQIQERNQLQELLNEQEKLASALQQVYVVEEGETVESICRKFYGSTEQVTAVRLLNSLSEEEEPKAGQKIFLP